MFSDVFSLPHKALQIFHFSIGEKASSQIAFCSFSLHFPLFVSFLARASSSLLFFIYFIFAAEKPFLCAFIGYRHLLSFHLRCIEF